MGWFWNNCTVIFYLFKRLPVVILTGFNDKSATGMGRGCLVALLNLCREIGLYTAK